MASVGLFSALFLLFLAFIIFNYFSMLDSYMGVGKNFRILFIIPFILDLVLALSFISYFQISNILIYFVFILSISGRFIE